jgi:hypothetical protein
VPPLPTAPVGAEPLIFLGVPGKQGGDRRGNLVGGGRRYLRGRSRCGRVCVLTAEPTCTKSLAAAASTDGAVITNAMH